MTDLDKEVLDSLYHVWAEMGFPGVGNLRVFAKCGHEEYHEITNVVCADVKNKYVVYFTYDPESRRTDLEYDIYDSLLILANWEDVIYTLDSSEKATITRLNRSEEVIENYWRTANGDD